MLGDNEVCAVLAVKDAAAAATFYEEKLGLKKGMSSPGGTFYSSGRGGVFVYPSEFAGTNQATAAAWTVEDVEGMVEQLKAKGVTFEHYDMPGVELQGDVHVMGDMHAAWFKDPDGNILNIVNQVG
jgi:catechol 2,3-dioxygenase-like lactoylglutathione lyase family enzyme